MRINRLTVGAIVSFAWLAVAVYLLLWQPDKTWQMAPNEWGDFLAGAFAPLAFFWLVIGYMQQGDELRLSTQALRLQAEELKNSVEQQRALVEVSRLQVESEREALAFERELRRELSLPKLSVTPDGGSFRDGRYAYDFRLSNAGHAATELTLRATLDDGSPIHFLDAPLFDRGAQRSFSIVRDKPLSLRDNFLFIEYKDGLGKPQSATFLFGRATADLKSLLSFEIAVAP